MTAPKTTQIKRQRIERSAVGLREALFDQLEKLDNSEITTQEATSFSKLAAEIIRCTEMQLRFEKMRLESQVPSNLPEMNLGESPLKTLSSGKK